MRDFSFVAPTTRSEILGLLAETDRDRRIIAGGTGLLNLMKQQLVSPAELVSLHQVKDLGSIELTDSHISIGALVSLLTLQQDERIRELLPVLPETLREVASPRIRSMATIGGSIAQADPNQDVPVTLVALGAVAVIESKNGIREVSLDEFYRDYYETVLQPDEMITAVKIPLPGTTDSFAFKKYTPASVEDYACVTVCIRLTLDQDICRSCRIVLGGVGPTIIRAIGAEDLINGSVISDESFAETLIGVAALAAEDTDPTEDTRGSIDYKRQMVRVWVKRCILNAVGKNR